MEDNLKKLFDGFTPTVTPDSDFMARLQKNMEALEAVKAHVSKMQRRNRIAVVTAAFAGFAMGVVCTLLFPLLCDFLGTLSFSLPQINIPEITVDRHITGWIVSCELCVLTAVHTYNLTLARLSVKD